MIEYVKGTLTKKSTTSVILEANGLGYGINVSSFVLNTLPEQGKEIKLFISESTNMYSNTNTWYGFLSQDEKELFEAIKSVDKIGPKGSLDILSRLGNNVKDFKIFIIQQDIEKLHEIFGFTNKKAEKLILGLKDKISSLDINLENFKFTETSNSSKITNHENDAVEALKSLGYNAIVAKKAVAEILNNKKLDEEISLETIIKTALKKI